MGLFDTASGRSDRQIGSTPISNIQTEDAKKGLKSVISEDVLNARAEKLKKRANFKTVLESKLELDKTNPIFQGTKRVHENGGAKIISESSNISPRKQAVIFINEAREIFYENMVDSLFINQISNINTESLILDKNLKNSAKIREFNYEMCKATFKEIRKSSNFENSVTNGNTIGVVGELWELATECATIEAGLRFNPDKVIDAVGLNYESLNEYLQNEINDLNIRVESVNNYYHDLSALLLLESEDVVSEIKDKVKSEIDDYKKSAEKMADVKKNIREKLTSTDEELEEKNKDDGDETGGNTDDSKPSKNEDKNGKNGEIDDKTSKSGQTPGDTSKTAEEPISDEKKTDISGGKNDNSEDDSEKNTSEKTGEKDDNTTTEEDLLENQKKLHLIAPKITQEIEDAVSFASSYTNTFNTGDEKFETIRNRLAQELVTAMDNNDLDTMNRIKQEVQVMIDRLTPINDANNQKYKDMISKLKELRSSITFELGKRIEGAATEAVNTRSSFENLVLQIAKRKIAQNSTTNEDGYTFGYEESKSVLDEAIIDYTMMETFNTLKILDSNNSVHVESVNRFFEGIKN